MLPVAKGKASTDAWTAVSAALGDGKEEGRWLPWLPWGPVGTCSLLAWGQWDAAVLG